MVFVVLGSQKFQFNRLLEEVDKLVDQGIITEEIETQVGASTYKPRNYNAVDFYSREDFRNLLKKSNIVITHGGSSSIISAISLGKKVIAVPRLAKFGEHVDDHQEQLIQAFTDKGYIEGCLIMENLGEAYKKCLEKTYNKFESNTDNFLEVISTWLMKEFNK